MLEITNDKLNNFFENNTIITVKEAEKIGIKRQILSNLCKKGILERVKQGVYQKNDTITDEFVKIQKNNNVIFSNILSSIPAVTFVFFVSTRRVFVKNKKGFTLKEKYFIYFSETSLAEVPSSIDLFIILSSTSVKFCTNSTSIPLCSKYRANVSKTTIGRAFPKCM